MGNNKVNYLTINNLNLVYSETYEARSKWQNILLELGVKKPSIDSISKKWRDNPEDCYREGLSEWLNGDVRTWEDIFCALSSPIVDCNDVINKIKKKYSPNQTEQSKKATEFLTSSPPTPQAKEITNTATRTHFTRPQKILLLITLIIIVPLAMLVIILPPSIIQHINSSSTKINSTLNNSPPKKFGLNLHINNTAIFSLSKFSIKFIETFSLSTYNYLNISVSRGLEIDYGEIIVFHISDCQAEVTHVNQPFSWKIFRSNQEQHFEITTAYYLKESIISYNIFLTPTVNLTTSNDCLATLIIFDDPGSYLDFVDYGIWNNFQTEICINDYLTTETIAFQKNSYNLIGMHISPGFSNSFTIDLVISGTVYQFDLRDIVHDSYGSCEIYTDIINECTITPSRTRAEHSEACVVAVIAGAVTMAPSINVLIISMFIVVLYCDSIA